jgi:hypothetical protein
MFLLLLHALSRAPPMRTHDLRIAWPVDHVRPLRGTAAPGSDNGSYAEAVCDAATRFRTALEQGNLRLRSLADFLNGSCGDASELEADLSVP